MRIRWRLLSLASLVAALAHAQVVRGTVTDALTRAPISGVVVQLDDAGVEGAAPRRAAVAVLTDARGEFAVQASAAGRFVLTAKRVGLKRYASPPFALGVGDARRHDITLEAIDFTAALPVIEVVTDAPCSIRPNEAAQVAVLWDETRAALTASRLALRDRLFTATMVRYTRQLSPSSLRITREERSVRRGTTERPFRALTPEELSNKGYMQADPDGAYSFFAPDAEILTSPEFLRDHCFSLVPRAREGLVGLAFEPLLDRTTPEIRGSFWMDSASHELRLVEFRYLNVSQVVPRGDPRGEVRFSVTPNGTWYVSRWFIRMPELGIARSSGLPGSTAPMEVLRYKEDGGEVTPDGARSTSQSASLTGRATDSTGHLPLRGATVRLSGTAHRATTRADGYFRLDSLPAGGFTLILEHPDYEALGLLAAEQELDIAEASQSVTALRAIGTEPLLRRLCDRAEMDEDRGALRLVVTRPDVTTVRIRFDTFEKPNSGATSIRITPQTEVSGLDEARSATFCNIPARQPLRIELLGADRALVARDSLRLRPGSIHALRMPP
ncbi:MAG: carboxypeptidase regulatory-like domain-containing protein [Gemmatimonadetes bacterium]|nr:carboxypeptidase regulatory-like domain-containing protein [Gemmatimonadota bacterium]